MLGRSEENTTRRKYPRREMKKHVGVLYRGQYFVAQSTEIGEGGISIRSDMLLDNDGCVILSFQVPGGGFMTTRARVRSTQKEEAGFVTHGLSFENISFSSKRQIRAFVSSRVSA